MRHLCFSLYRYIIVLIVVLTVFVGCTKQILPQTPPLQNITKYNTYKNQNDIGVAIDIFFEKERQLQIFGADLSSYGILPVHVIVENNNNQSFLIENKNIKLLIDKNIPAHRNALDNASNSMAKDKQDSDERAQTVMVASNLAMSAGMFIVPVLPLAAVYFTVLGITAANSVSDTEPTIHALRKNAFYDKMFYKGDKYDGFMYFPLKDIVAEKGNSILQIDIKNITTEKTVTFQFDIDTTKIENGNDDAIAPAIK